MALMVTVLMPGWRCPCPARIRCWPKWKPDGESDL